jgi:hypothetical protein
MNEPTSTADYRKYPKGPNFGLIVILFGVTIIVMLFGAWLLLSDTGKKLIPGRHNPHPNSYVLPAPSDTTAA